ISYFTEDDEFIITQTIANIVKEDSLNVLAYNICADHIHLLLVCEEENVPIIMQRIKGKTARAHNSNKGINPLVQKENEKSVPLWTQKFGCKEITTEAHLFTAIDYIKHNRSKHNLPQHSNKGFKPLVENFICDYEHAFRHEYKGGFDVVIGNPPYVDIKALDYKLVKELFKNYHTAENRINLYSIFIEKGYYILKNKGILSFINPNSILVNSSYTSIRKFLINDMTRIVKLPDATFEDATVETIIFEFQKKSNQRNLEAIIYNKGEKINSIDNIRAKTIDKENWKLNGDYNFNIYINEEQLKLIIKLEVNSTLLGEIADFTLGITPYDKYRGHSQETIKNREYHSLTKINQNYKPLITGENITRYSVSNLIKEYISYGEWLGASREERFFKDERILVRQIVSGNPPRIYAGFTDEELYFTQIGFGIIPKKLNVKYIIGILNSTLINFYHKYRFLDLEKELFQKILIANCKSLPIKNIPNNYENNIISNVDLIINLNKELQEQSQKFQRTLEREFFDKGFKPLANKELKPLANQANYVANPANSLPKKLQDWYLLSYGDFIKELEKKKVKLSLSQKAEWEDYFLQESKKALALKNNIDTTDKEIDAMVYELYGLTEEEISIVENS
ncbi:MAG: TaqI-like C-terminal specificity domain-containing protein, partial [Lutibacter sp.]|nr:TaqI-like C-terminal specificity domain-containing protein [Lutibacter sp.]